MNAAIIWKPVPEWPGYEVSNTGLVRSVPRIGADGRKLQGKPLAPRTSRSGHQHVMVYRDRYRTPRAIHRLVLEAFVGPRPEGMECCHGDGNPANNNLENLRWDTHAENSKDRVRQGTHHETAKTHCKRGHLFFPENLTRSRRPGSRKCLTCERARAAASRYGTDIQSESTRYYIPILESAIGGTR